MNTRSMFLLAVTATLGATSCDFLRGYAEGESALMPTFRRAEPAGFYRMLFEDFQSLNTDTMQRSAIPWKLLGAALLATHHDGEPSEAALLDVYARRYGLVTPQRVANWPGGQGDYVFTRPMGVGTGEVKRGVPDVSVEVSNTGCATCHASTLWDADGAPTPDVAWVGAPNTNVNLERYAKEAFAALKWSTQNEEKTFEVMRKAWPDVSQVEIDSIRNFLLPNLRDVIAEVEKKKIGGFTPYHNGGAALTNGAATIQYYLGAIERDRYHSDQIAFAAMPTLGALGLKRSILIDGVYAPPGWSHYGALGDVENSLPNQTIRPRSERHRDAMAGVVTLVTVGTLGVEPEVALTNKERMRDVIDYAFDDYQPPPFPGPIDDALADQGATLYMARCAGCHGVYAQGPDGWRITSYPNVLVPQAAIGTDPARWQAVTDRLLELFADNPLSKVITPLRGVVHAPPALDGVWANAPYLHNGSVPSIWHLMHPEERPARFEVGGHRLDYETLGIAGELAVDNTWRYPADHTPWTEPEVYDTTQPGRSNAGHTQQFVGLSEEDKRALIEFLKRL